MREKGDNKEEEERKIRSHENEGENRKGGHQGNEGEKEGEKTGENKKLRK